MGQLPLRTTTFALERNHPAREPIPSCSKPVLAANETPRLVRLSPIISELWSIFLALPLLLSSQTISSSNPFTGFLPSKDRIAPYYSGTPCSGAPYGGTQTPIVLLKIAHLKMPHARIPPMAFNTPFSQSFVNIEIYS